MGTEEMRKKSKKSHTSENDTETPAPVDNANEEGLDARKEKKRRKREARHMKTDVNGADEHTELKKSRKIESAAVADTGSQDVKKTEKSENIKPNKKQKKKKKKKSAENKDESPQSPVDPSVSVAKKEAISYLQRWKNEKDAWKFQTVRQVWLLQHMYNTDLVDQDTFEILLQYLDGLKGKARTLTIEEAEKRINEDEEDDTETPTDKAATSEDILDRARQLLQTLS